MSRVGLICVIVGKSYERYAEKLYDSACNHFLPEHNWKFFTLPGRPGWPAATLYRYHVILENQAQFKQFSHLYLCDADMRFEDTVGDEILGRLVATIHPGYVTMPRRSLPYERNPSSLAYVPDHRGWHYYAGGFIGGERLHFLLLANLIAKQIDEDERNGVLATWHDESHLNSLLAIDRPTVELSPSYCYPDHDDWYLTSWTERYERKLVALDKDASEREGR